MSSDAAAPRAASPRRAAKPPAAMRGRAVSDLAYIRDTMDRSRRFTAVSGWGGVAMALVAFTAAPAARARPDPAGWLAVWLVAAGLGLLVGVLAIVLKSRKLEQPLLRGAGRRFALGLGPPMLVGGLLTAALYSDGASALLPAMWLLIFGTALATAGTHSVPVIPAMGCGFLVAGTGAIFFGPEWGDFFMAAGFGGVNLAGGVIVIRRYGG